MFLDTTLWDYENYWGDSSSNFQIGGSGPSGTVSVPSKSIELPGLGNVTIGGGTWTIGPGSSTNTGSREIAVALSNQYEQVMQHNLEAYRTKQITQSQAASNFDRLWQDYLQALNAAGSAEKAQAVADRQRGGKFDWFRAYRDPIGFTGETGIPGVVIGSPGGIVGWIQSNLLVVLLIVGAVWMVSRK